MGEFRYRAMDMAGRRQRGRAEAAGVAELARTLEARGLILIDAVDAGRDAERASSPGGFQPRRRRAVVEATRALGSLLSAGLPLARALETAAGVVGGPVGAALRTVRSDVERGEALATALAWHGRTFPPLYVGLVRAGERSGDLAGAFRRLADQLEREDELRSRIVSASIYPLLLAAVGGIAIVVLLLFVLPRFVELLEGAGATLPRSTAALLAVSRALQAAGPFLPVPLAGLALGAGAYVRTEPGRRIVAGLALRLPLVRAIRSDALAGRFARLAAVLLGGGAPMLTALEHAAESLADPLARDEVLRIRARIREGASLDQAVREGRLFPPLLGQLVAVGEEAGRVEEFLARAADLFEERTARALQRLVTLMEPAMIVGFGLVVGFVALSLLQAIYGVNAGAFR
ncbi:MAG TPA: type II secretion system F family protein [Longimicrobiales bacterium]